MFSLAAFSVSKLNYILAKLLCHFDSVANQSGIGSYEILPLIAPQALDHPIVRNHQACYVFDILADSCKTAKCGPHKKCVLRSGQPKCVCAIKCKTKNQRPKRGGANHHAHSQFKSNHQGLNQQHHHQHHHQSSIDDNDDTSHDDVHIFNNDLNNTNRSHRKSDKIISIIAPIHHSSNLSSSHRPKKIHNSARMHSGGGGGGVIVSDGTPSTNSSRRNMVKSSKHSVANPNGNPAARQHHQSGINHRHKITAHKNEYSNSSLIDNNIVNVNHRRQTSVEQQFKSKFYGHDIPYPPIDLPVSWFTARISD